jgi:Ca-activated chloride channel homolog
MHFGNAQILWLLLAWPLLVWLGWRALIWRERVAGRIGRPELLSRLYPLSVKRWRRRRLLLALAAVLLLIVAASRPQYGRIMQTTRSLGPNVLIALDCSASMKAQDVPPSRIERAKQSLDLLLHQLGGNRVGIVAFAGVAFLQCPMTLDHGMAALILKSLDTDSIGVPGTDIGGAIKVATDAFERGAGEGGRALVLLTDGEDHGGKALSMAREAAAKKIRIYAVGIGTSRGAPLIEDAGGGFKEDRTGAKINTKLHMETLQQIAKATGGAAFDADNAPGPAVDAVARLISNQEKAELDSRQQILYQDRFQWFLVPALILIFWLMLLRPETAHPEAAPVENKPREPLASGQVS